MCSLSSYKQRERRECGYSRRFYRLNVYTTNLYPPTGNLDSKTAQEVLGLLKLTGERFHQTIVMITHIEDLSQLCDRVIHIEDGKIVDDHHAAAFSRNITERTAGGVFDEEQ